MSEKRSENDSTASPLGDSQAPGPLRRWIQRRQRVKAEDEKRIPDPADNTVDREAEPFARTASTKTSGDNAAAGRQTRKPAAKGIEEEIESGSESGSESEPERGIEGESEEKILTDADMPPIESLDEDSDYSGFLSPGVSEELRRRALRKLFFSAAFNVRDGLDDYDDDFTSFEALGDMVTADMKHQKEVEAERAQAAQAKTENAPDTAQELSSTHESAQSTEPTAKTETTVPDERQDEHERAQDQFADRDKAQEAFENEPTEPTEDPDTATLATRHRDTETGDRQSTAIRQPPTDANHRSSDPSDPPPKSASKSAGATPEKSRDERETAQNQPAAEKAAYKSFDNDPAEDPDTATTTKPRHRSTEASKTTSPPHRPPTPRAK